MTTYFEHNEQRPHFDVIEFKPDSRIEVREHVLSDSAIRAFRTLLSRQSDNKDLAAFRVLELG